MSDLLDRLRRHIKIMAPHQREREAGQLLIEAANQIADDEATLHCECFHDATIMLERSRIVNVQASELDAI